jgi:hypothetical protein
MTKGSPKIRPVTTANMRAHSGGVVIEFIFVVPVLFVILWSLVDWCSYAFQHQRFLRVASTTTDYYLRTQFSVAPAPPAGWTTEQVHAREIANRILVASQLESLPGADQPVPSVPGEIASRVAITCMGLQSAGGPGSPVTMVSRPMCNDRPMWVIARVTAPTTGLWWERIFASAPTVTRVYTGVR